MLNDLINFETVFNLDVTTIEKSEKRIGEINSGTLDKIEDCKIEKDKKYVMFDFECFLDEFTLACLDDIQYEDNGYIKFFSHILKTKVSYTLLFTFSNDLISKIELYKDKELYGSKNLFELKENSNFEYIKPIMLSILQKVLKENKEDFIIDIGIYNTKNTLSHANIIYIEQGSDGIHINFYEPHGANIESERHNYINALLKTLYIGKYYNMSNYCDLGLQIIAKDRLGFCTMFSFLWIYTGLQLKKKLKKEYLSDFGNIEMIIKEEFYMYAYKNNINKKSIPNALYNWVVLFTYFFIESYNNFRITNPKIISSLCPIKKSEIVLGADLMVE